MTKKVSTFIPLKPGGGQDDAEKSELRENYSVMSHLQPSRCDRRLGISFLRFLVIMKFSPFMPDDRKI